jgi:hypothetical protein
MAPAKPTERLAAARSRLDSASQFLMAPSSGALENCREALEQAISQLTPPRASALSEDREPGVSAGDGSSRTDLLASAYQLRTRLGHAKQLLDSAARFYSGWERILGAMSGGYTSSGEPAAAQRPGKLCWRG